MEQEMYIPEITPEEMKSINQFTKKELKAEDVYVFSVVLCDNEIDRDHERFSDEALEKLSKLFVGVTGITDHEASSKNQTARIYSAAAERMSGQLTSDGKAYIRLKARAYMPRTNTNADLIRELESGIKKEVSVGCSVKRRTCSICGKDISLCGHIRGKRYGGKECFVILDEPTDAYEWSFVAVPAQKAAGVIKNYQGADRMNIQKRLETGGEQVFTAEEVNVLAKELQLLREKAADGDAYRQRLEMDISRTVMLVLPELKQDVLKGMTGGMSIRQLEELCGVLSKKAAAAVPLRPQLASDGHIEKNSMKNNDYRNI